jgi:hypothetical protein
MVEDGDDGDHDARSTWDTRSARARSTACRGLSLGGHPSTGVITEDPPVDPTMDPSFGGDLADADEALTLTR